MADSKISVVTTETSVVVNVQEPGSIEQAVHIIMQAQVNRDLNEKSADELSNEGLLIRFLRQLGEATARHTGELKEDDDCWGPRKYGTDFKNDVFEMHPYWWYGCTCHLADLVQKFEAENPHAHSCEILNWRMNRKFPYEDERIEMVGCECGVGAAFAEWLEDHGQPDHSPDCRTVVSNFLCGDFHVIWYKYIGRGMSFDPTLTRQELEDMFQRCFSSLSA